MDDKELPGFKINDYSGDGNDGTEEVGRTESLAATDDAQSGGASVAGGSAENSPVTHGEGEIKPVMVESEQVGGAEEKAPKTASEGLGEHFGALGGVSNGLKSDAKIEGPTQVTEAEARAMLIEDNARAKEALKKANSRGKKTLVAVIVVAVLLVVAGVATSIILSGMRKSEGNDGEQEGNGGNTSVVEKPEESPDELEVVELSLDDELVQRIYNNFSVIPALFDGWWEFYVDEGVKKGEISREYMLRLAGANLWNSSCVGDYEYGNGGKVENECASGEAVRAKIEEMFGERLELTADDKLRSFCGGMVYDAINDEFYQAGNGCGGWSPISMERVLVKAERKGDEIVLYEKVLMFDETAYYQVGETEIVRQAGEYDLEVAGEKIGEYTVPEDVLNKGGEFYNAWLTENRANLAGEYGTQFKWTFEKNAEGNYVFKGLERVR